jgi:hypothetical protein
MIQSYRPVDVSGALGVGIRALEWSGNVETYGSRKQYRLKKVENYSDLVLKEAAQEEQKRLARIAI